MRNRAAWEPDRWNGAFVSDDLDIGKSGDVVDGGVYELPARLVEDRSATSNNGKAEWFIPILLGVWAYGAIYRDSAERNAALAGWLDFYNRCRPHGALSHKPPIARPHELNNLLGSYT